MSLRHGLLLALLAGSLTISTAVAAAPDLSKIGTPRPLTDPRSLVSEASPSAGPLSIADLHFLRSSWFGTWTPDGKDIVISTDLLRATIDQRLGRIDGDEVGDLGQFIGFDRVEPNRGAR